MWRGDNFSFVCQSLGLWNHPNFKFLFLGSCLLLAAKFNGDMKREKIKEVIEVWYHSYFVITHLFKIWMEIIMLVSSCHYGEFQPWNHSMQSVWNFCSKHPSYHPNHDNLQLFHWSWWTATALFRNNII